MEIQVAFLVNVKTNEGIMTRQVVRTIQAEDMFGDDADNVGQVNAIYIRFPWQPETPIEFHPRPYWGQV